MAILYEEWLRRKEISSENQNMLNCKCLLDKNDKNLCLNDIKTQVAMILAKNNITTNWQVIKMLQCL